MANQISTDTILAVILDKSLETIALKAQMSEIVAQNNNLTSTIKALEASVEQLTKERDSLKDTLSTRASKG